MTTTSGDTKSPYRIQACIAGRWQTVGNRLDKVAAEKLADMWAAETGYAYRVLDIE